MNKDELEATVAENILPNCVKRDWVNCPVCGESDMRKEEDKDGYAIIHCVNHACASNGGSNADAIRPKHSRQMTLDLQAINRIVADQTKTLSAENKKLRSALTEIAGLQDRWPAWSFQDLYEDSRSTAKTALS